MTICGVNAALSEREGTRKGGHRSEDNLIQGKRENGVFPDLRGGGGGNSS